MALQLIGTSEGRQFLFDRSVVDRKAVIGHLRDVLKSFAAKPQYRKFYIGITGNLEERLEGHRARRDDFLLMIPIYSEPRPYFEDSFDSLERDAIAAFAAGVPNTASGRLLRCDNVASGISPKNWLYILVG